MSAFGVWTCPTCNVTYEETDGHECVASDLAARVRELETENAKLKEGLDRLVRIYNERTDEVDKVREERNEAEYEAVELRAENAKLRKCVEAADEIDWLCSDDGILIRREGDIIEYIDGWRSAVRKYRAARAEVDK